jgi:hypothetical protein
MLRCGEIVVNENCTVVERTGDGVVGRSANAPLSVQQIDHPIGSMGCLLAVAHCCPGAALPHGIHSHVTRIPLFQ